MLKLNFGSSLTRPATQPTTRCCDEWAQNSPWDTHGRRESSLSRCHSSAASPSTFSGPHTRRHGATLFGRTLVSGLVLALCCSFLFLAISRVPLAQPVSPIDESFGDKPRVLRNETLNFTFWKLKQMGPAFAVKANAIRFLKAPTDFYQDLLNRIAAAKHRIVLASLYIGTEKPECDELIAAMMKALSKNKDLTITILIDYLRGTRGLKNKSDSLSLLLPLFLNYPNQVHLRFFHTPLLSGFWKSLVPERVSEIIGVQHIKGYIFDDTMLMSGANLSQSYFTNRLDRYIVIEDEQRLANYFTRLVETIGSFSYIPDTTGQLRLSPGVYSPFQQPEKFQKLARARLLPMLSTEFNQHLNFADMHDTYIFPLLQMSPFEIWQEEEATSFILEHAGPKSYAYITSPYFNLNPHYVSLLLRGAGHVDIITAHPEANGFFTAKGMSGYIPAAYTWVEKAFFRKVHVYHQQHRIRVFEWRKKDWTYHAKGLWLGPEGKLPAITLIGSSNLGIRSARRDLEAQLFILTENEQLQHRLEEERLHFFHEDIQQVTEEMLASPDRHVPLHVRWGAEFVRTFL